MIAIQYIAKPDFTIRYILSLNAAMQFISIPSAIFCNIIVCTPVHWGEIVKRTKIRNGANLMKRK